MWTIGVSRTGNEAGLTEQEWRSASENEQREIVKQAEHRLREAGAHYLVESAADCLETIDEIAGRIARGDRP
jgi:phosphonoacetaldehyde hydrolase